MWSLLPLQTVIRVALPLVVRLVRYPHLQSPSGSSVPHLFQHLCLSRGPGGCLNEHGDPRCFPVNPRAGSSESILQKSPLEKRQGCHGPLVGPSSDAPPPNPVRGRDADKGAAPTRVWEPIAWRVQSGRLTCPEAILRALHRKHFFGGKSPMLCCDVALMCYTDLPQSHRAAM
jgi:hypothetical protein